MCDLTLGGFGGLVCTQNGPHAYGPTFTSPGGDLRGEEHVDGGGSDG